MTAVNTTTGSARAAMTLVPNPSPPALGLEQALVEGSPWNWVDRHGQVEAALAGLLETFVEYFNARYAWTTEHTIPPCWARHGALVEELTTLMWSRWSAFEAPKATVEAAQVWHTYYLPGFLGRVNGWLGTHTAAECRSGKHQQPRTPGHGDGFRDQAMVSEH
jgi:hypothetical protein